MGNVQKGGSKGPPWKFSQIYPADTIFKVEELKLLLKDRNNWVGVSYYEQTCTYLLYMFNCFLPFLKIYT